MNGPKHNNNNNNEKTIRLQKTADFGNMSLGRSSVDIAISLDKITVPRKPLHLPKFPFLSGYT
jgi:hypothetical protein